MENEPGLSVRRLAIDDIKHICSYWMNSEPDYLVSLGVDLAKLPSEEEWAQFLATQVELPDYQKLSFGLIWEYNGEPIGHSNINKIYPGDHACMHLHIWNAETRRKGFGLELIRKSLPVFFQAYDLKRIFCEPYALNPAPNRIMEKAGFTFIEEVVMIPGSINFEQPVKRWMITREEVLNNSLASGNIAN